MVEKKTLEKECLGRKRCRFFEENMKQLPVCAEWYKEQYCREEFTRCARYQVAALLGWNRVPMMLHPDQNSRAETILTESCHFKNVPR